MAMQTTTKYEPVIGLEVHTQLQTKSKMFCSCSAAYAGAEPNTHVCPVCMAMPGVLPVINKQAVEYALMTGLARPIIFSDAPDISEEILKAMDAVAETAEAKTKAEQTKSR